jgi:hypothetical protein
MGRIKKSSKSSNNNFLINPGISKKEKNKRGKYLAKRINDLYETISEWIKDLKDYSLKKTTITMEGEKIFSADIYLRKKIIVSLKPTGLWAFGVNCRIDLVSGKETNVIFDIAKETGSPDWQLISSEAGKKPKKLTKVIFRNLLKRINE